MIPQSYLTGELWFLYIKDEKTNRYRAYNWNSGQFVGNLIYASLFNETDRLTAEKSLQLPENKGIQYQFRKAT
jgi:hypothetical protein